MVVNNIYKLYLLTIMLLLYNCNNKNDSIEIKNYQYEYHETTGIGTNIHYGGKTIPIKFHPKSNKFKLDLLNSLNPSILYPSSERIFLIGKLYSEIKIVPEKTPNGDPLAEGGEKYQEFELIHWYILCPFKEQIGDVGEMSYIKRERLLPSDIGIGGIGNLLINVDDYQKQE